MISRSKEEIRLKAWMKSKKLRTADLAELFGLKEVKYLKKSTVWKSGDRPKRIVDFLQKIGQEI